jgi:hypothetical protein
MSAITPRFAGGLPGLLPQGETLLWQGKPSTAALLRHAFHIRLLALYFGLILLACLVTELRAGWPAPEIAVAMLHKAGIALVPLALIVIYAWGIERSTVYSITSRRIVLSFGIALPMKINIPFARIDGAGLRRHADGTGDIPLRLGSAEKMSYFILWPHARPWRVARTEPMLRCVPNVQEATSILGRALAAHAAAQGVAARLGLQPAGVPARPDYQHAGIGQPVAAE